MRVCGVWMCLIAFPSTFISLTYKHSVFSFHYRNIQKFSLKSHKNKLRFVQRHQRWKKCGKTYQEEIEMGGRASEREQIHILYFEAFHGQLPYAAVSFSTLYHNFFWRMLAFKIHKHTSIHEQFLKCNHLHKVAVCHRKESI